MSIIQLSEAQSRLPELIAGLAQTGDILIKRDGQPVARLTTPEPRTSHENDRPSLRDLKPVSLGAPLRPLTRDDEPLVSPQAENSASLDASRPSLRDLKPTSVGAVLRPLTRDDDLLDEMLRQ